MKRFIITASKLLLLLAILALAQRTLAAASTTTEFGTFNTLGDYVTTILKWARPIIGSLAILMLIIAGYLYMTSGGNPESIKKAKDIILGVVTGLALLFLANLLFNTIGVTNITTPSTTTTTSAPAP